MSQCPLLETLLELRILPKARARTGAFGANVYPLEAYGLLLGLPENPEATALVVAPLLVGKTSRWYEVDGRFDRIDEAAIAAKATFAPFGLQPIGLFCTDPDAGDLPPTSIEDTAPRRADLPWLLLRWMGGGETIWMPAAKRLSGDKWLEAELVADRSPRPDPMRNPRRLHSMWLRAWDVPDYGNKYETELVRLEQARNNKRSRLQSDPPD